MKEYNRKYGLRVKIKESFENTNRESFENTNKGRIGRINFLDNCQDINTRVLFDDEGEGDWGICDWGHYEDLTIVKEDSK